MSWRKIEKVWDEVRAAQEPKRNLSKQPKKSREVKMSKVQELHDLVTTAQNVDDMNALSTIVEITDLAETLTQKVRNASQEGFLEDDFYVNLVRDIMNQMSEVGAVASDLGVDFDDVMEDYSGSDINGYVDNLEDLIEAVQNLYETFDFLNKSVRG
ncbi:hypothetical protein OAR88_00200 [bacterium]|nr:hypothetical protein [bacterium]